MPYLTYHDLDFRGPGGVFFVLDSFPKISLRIVRIFTRQPSSFSIGELLLSMVGYEMVFNVDLRKSARAESHCACLDG